MLFYCFFNGKVLLSQPPLSSGGNDLKTGRNRSNYSYSDIFSFFVFIKSYGCDVDLNKLFNLNTKCANITGHFKVNEVDSSSFNIKKLQIFFLNYSTFFFFL